MLLPIGVSVLLLAIPSAGFTQSTPVNLSGHATVSLAEAGLSPMPDHPASTTATSVAHARVVRQGGQTITAHQDAKQRHCRSIDAESLLPTNCGQD